MKLPIRELLKTALETYSHAPDGALVQLAERVDAVLKLHVRNSDDPGLLIPWGDYCDECNTPWPCPTIRALDGER